MFSLVENGSHLCHNYDQFHSLHIGILKVYFKTTRGYAPKAILTRWNWNCRYSSFESHRYWETTQLGDSNCVSYSHCWNWSLQVAQLPSSMNFQKQVQWISKNVSKCFISSDSRSDDDMIISHYYHRYRKRKTRRFWLHPYIEKNLNCRLLVATKELQECDSKFLAFYWMKKDTYYKLMELIIPAIHYVDSNMRECVSPEEPVLITLR